MPLKTMFEKETCGRCGGCGRYSYNAIDGDTCYGCGGKGERLTKRGAQAAGFYTSLLSVPASEVKVGDQVWTDGVTLGGRTYHEWVKVVAIEAGVQRYGSKDGAATEWEWREQPVVTFVERSKSGREVHYQRQPTTIVRKAWNADALAEAKAWALRFQASLTQRGEPRKTRRA